MLKELYPQIEKLLHSRGLRDFELYYERVQSKSYEAKDSAVEAAQGAVQEGLALRIFGDHRVAFGYSTDLRAEGLEVLVESAVAALPWIDPEEDAELAAPLPLSNSDLKNFDSSLDQIPPSRKIETALALEAAAKKVDPRVKHVRSATYEEKILSVELRHSGGLNVSHRRSRCSIGVMSVAEADGEAEGAYEFDSSPFFERLDAEKIGLASARLALSYLGATTPGSRRVPVILDPLVAGEILEVLAGSFQGDSVFKKRSYLEAKLGQSIYSPSLNVYDDSLLPEGAGTAPFDGEGQPSRRLALVENGVIANFLLDTLYGRKLGQKPNGSLARRGIQRPPFISFANLLIPAGLTSDEALFREVGSGILVTETFGMHAANPVTGDFSVGIQGFLIEGGEKRG
ncbi:MAG: TldD/PmbA family protein, partial [Deltaproteobacteria bacterium]|nr:TldD/PmbA family protein [Deltaproteobacteria bacterium]